MLFRVKNGTGQRGAIVTITPGEVTADFCTRFLKNRHHGMGK
ncbi:MAG: hypothetical protein V1269_04280 [Deltaproteobacteria bacterium]|nr:hypothetical protein [SAR324 cluster bacterium]MEE1575394.1 hypothetical protein [Deltaproteobacteria bacterium]